MIASGDKDDDKRELILGFAEQQTAYQSASQSARVLTEGWVEQQAFCTNCGNDRLTKFANNRPLADFWCASCNEVFELKGKKGAFGSKVADGAYEKKIERLKSNTMPQLPRARSRRTNFWILPVLVLGTSPKTTWRGHL